MSFAVTGIDHVEVFVRDIEAAARWYADVLGLSEVGRWEPEPVMIGAGSTKLALFRADNDSLAGEGARSWHRVAWATDRDGLAAAQKHLTARGIPFRGPIDHGTSHSIYFEDPEGHRLEITAYV
jgi:catechol-2,3-dioxygenase